MIDFDPLTADWHRVWRHQYRPFDGLWRTPDCDCDAKPDQLHTETCSVTPCYASCVAALNIRPREVYAELAVVAWRTSNPVIQKRWWER